MRAVSEKTAAVLEAVKQLHPDVATSEAIRDLLGLEQTRQTRDLINRALTYWRDQDLVTNSFQYGKNWFLTPKGAKELMAEAQKKEASASPENELPSPPSSPERGQTSQKFIKEQTETLARMFRAMAHLAQNFEDTETYILLAEGPRMQIEQLEKQLGLSRKQKP